MKTFLKMMIAAILACASLALIAADVSWLVYLAWIVIVEVIFIWLMKEKDEPVS